jgi:hypothetical protein
MGLKEKNGCCFNCKWFRIECNGVCDDADKCNLKEDGGCLNTISCRPCSKFTKKGKTNK